MKIPTLRDIESYRLAEDKLEQLKLQQHQLRQEESDMRGQLSASHDIDGEVDALLTGSLVATATVTRDAIGQVQRQLRITTEAIERQKKAVDCERSKASAEIRQQVRPQYQKIVKRMASILASLREAAVEEYEFRNGLRDGDVMLSNDFILPYADCGEPASDGQRHDSIARWEHDARRDGMI